MESAGVLRIIRKEHDYKARTVGHKLFLGDPALYEALGGDNGIFIPAPVYYIGRFY
jgi:hypothetical protein